MLLLLGMLAMPVWAVDIDGRVSPQEWREARHIVDFRKVQPLNGEPASLATESWVLATPSGLAVAFRNIQPPSVPRTRQRVQRDFREQVDRVNVMIDFDGDHRAGYNFAVASSGGIYDAIITNETQFNQDWDGNWRHAVSEDEAGWSIEMLIPWHIAPMRKSSGASRVAAIYLDRVIGATGERMAWPQASYERPRFLSDFAVIEVPSYSQHLLAVTPYASGLYDFVAERREMAAGVDVFWKPNGQLQLAATVSPDFGQVESDDLVVNFSATETFIRDKRPFFTENQGIFEFTTPSEFSQLLYTRRMGGVADDGQGSADITAALKLNGSTGAAKFGLLAVDEAEQAGRTFSAVRAVRDFSTQNLGLLVTHVDRPYRDRQAAVIGVDHNWRPTPRWNVRTRLIGSNVEQRDQSSRDIGATIWADYEMDHGWRQQWIGMHFGSQLQLNDAGYLSRNSFNYAHWQLSRRFTDLPTQSRYSSKDWRARVTTDRNDHGRLLRYLFRLNRESRLRNGGSEFAQININSAGADDLLTRGNGPVRLPPRANGLFRYERPRHGNWAHRFEIEGFGAGLSGNAALGYRLEVVPTYFVSDAFRVHVGVEVERWPDWLVWQHDNLIGSFSRREAKLDAGFNWSISSRQELRLKLQAIGLNADLRQGYRVTSGGDAQPSADSISDFSIRNLALQLRYRFELAPLSYLYVVYGRGGYEQETVADEPDRLLRSSFSLRDDEQLLLKLSYRFES